MNVAFAAISVAFLAGLAYRELVISWASSRWSDDAAVPRHAFISGYYSTTSRALGTRILATATAIFALAVIYSRSSTAGPWVTAACLLALSTVLITHSLRTSRVAKQLGSGDLGPAQELANVRALRWHHSGHFALLIVVLGLQVWHADRSDAAALAAGLGAGFLASTMWNEVVVDTAIARGHGELTFGDRSTLLGYYLIMTVRAKLPNLAAVFLTIGITLAALTTETLADKVPNGIAGSSLVLFCLFLTISSLRSWRIASRLGSGKYRDFQLRPISGDLSRLHRQFVVTLITVAVLQVVAAS